MSKAKDPDLPPRRSDGEQTHAVILEAAMRIGSIEGLGGLTIGRLATELGISKSGVYAHFRSKERLQKETIAAAREVFQREVITPGLAATEGLGQLEGLCEAFLSYVERAVFPGGCFFAQVLSEFDAQAGPIRDDVAGSQSNWHALLEELARTAQTRGEIRSDLDPAQLAFELTAALELANYLFVLYDDAAIIERGRKAVKGTLQRAAVGTSGAVVSAVSDDQGEACHAANRCDRDHPRR